MSAIASMLLTHSLLFLSLKLTPATHLNILILLCIFHISSIFIIHVLLPYIAGLMHVQLSELNTKYTSTRQKIRIFWKIAITFLTLAQNPFNYSKRFNIILEINEGKLVHNYGNFNYKYMYFLKKCIFLRIFI